MAIAVYGGRTQANAKPKFREPAVVVNLVEVKRQRELDRKNEFDSATAELRRKANEDVMKGRAAARKYWAGELRALGIRPSEIAAYERLEALVSKATGVPVREIRGRSKEARIVLVRHCLMYWVRHRTGISLPRIGKLMGRDHSTIWYGMSAYVASRAAKGRTFQERRFPVDARKKSRGN